MKPCPKKFPLFLIKASREAARLYRIDDIGHCYGLHNNCHVFRIGGTTKKSLKGEHAMEILGKDAGNVSIISLGGRLDAYSANDVETKLNSLMEAGQVKLVVSLEQLDYISSSGLRVLLAALKKARKQQGDIKLACLKPYVKEVFDIAGFTQLFDVLDTAEDAIGSFPEA